MIHGWLDDEVSPSDSVETGSRLALCRMDWDRINATDILGTQQFTVVMVILDTVFSCSVPAVIQASGRLCPACDSATK